MQTTIFVWQVWGRLVADHTENEKEYRIMLDTFGPPLEFVSMEYFQLLPLYRSLIQ